MKYSFSSLALTVALLAFTAGCADQGVDVVDLNKVVEALVAVLDEGAVAKNAATKEGGDAVVSATSADGNAEVSSTAEIQAIEPEKQDPTKESDFLKRYAAKLNDLKVMNAPVGVSMTAAGTATSARSAVPPIIVD